MVCLDRLGSRMGIRGSAVSRLSALGIRLRMIIDSVMIGRACFSAMPVFRRVAGTVAMSVRDSIAVGGHLHQHHLDLNRLRRRV